MPKLKPKRRSLLQLNKRYLLMLGVIFVILLGGVLIYAKFSGDDPVSTGSTDSTAPPRDDYVNLNPPTDEQQQATDEYKKSLADDSPAPSQTTASGKKQVTPVITSVSGDEVRSYVSGVIEDGGTCTATATKTGASPVTKNSTGFADAAYTGCPPIQLSLSGSGWSIVVSYSSSTSEGASSPY